VTEFDLILAPFDVLGSMAHAQCCKHNWTFTKAEMNAFNPELKAFIMKIEKGQFEIAPGVEEYTFTSEFLPYGTVW